MAKMDIIRDADSVSVFGKDTITPVVVASWTNIEAFCCAKVLGSADGRFVMCTYPPAGGDHGCVIKVEWAKECMPGQGSCIGGSRL